MTDEGSLDSEGFVVVEVKVFLTQTVLLEELDGEVMGSIVKEE